MGVLTIEDVYVGVDVGIRLFLSGCNWVVSGEVICLLLLLLLLF